MKGVKKLQEEASYKAYASYLSQFLLFLLSYTSVKPMKFDAELVSYLSYLREMVSLSQPQFYLASTKRSERH